MTMTSVADQPTVRDGVFIKPSVPGAESGIRVGLLTGCQDRHYAFGLAMALASKGCSVDIIGSDEIDSPELHDNPKLQFLNFRRGSGNVEFTQKLSKLFIYYAKLFQYVARSKPK